MSEPIKYRLAGFATIPAAGSQSDATGESELSTLNCMVTVYVLEYLETLCPACCKLALVLQVSQTSRGEREGGEGVQ